MTIRVFDKYVFRRNVIEKQLSSLMASDRNFYLGIAMLMILLFHLFSGYKLQPWKAIFSRGFYGVDLFLFFSAIGLCFSYNRNTLRYFYYNRIKRVFPLFIMLALFRIIWQVWIGNNVSFGDVILTITGLSYFKVFGGIWVDWYLCALIILYALFPLGYKLLSKTGWNGMILLSVISSFFCLLFPLHWEHACLIGRIPIYSLGILLYLILVKKTIKMNWRVLKGFVLFGLCLFIVDIIIPNGRTRFLSPAFLTPLILLLLLSVYEFLIKK